MRNSNNKPRCEKLSLSKCPGVCRTYSDLQLAYAQQLQADENIAEFRCNVPLENFELTDGAYTTDFVCTTIELQSLQQAAKKNAQPQKDQALIDLVASIETIASTRGHVGDVNLKGIRQTHKTEKQRRRSKQ